MGGGGQKMSVFVHTQGIKTVHVGGGRGGVKKWQNSVHVVVECPLLVSCPVRCAGLGIRHSTFQIRMTSSL